MAQTLTPFQEKLLETLSFLEFMTIEKILLDIESEWLEEHAPRISMEDLHRELNHLTQMDYLKCLHFVRVKGKTKSKKDDQWIKLYPRQRNVWWRKWLRKFKGIS
jgi:hypothetical protein